VSDRYFINGITCAKCIQTVESIISQVNPSLELDFESQELIGEISAEDARQLDQLLSQSGYSLEVSPGQKFGLFKPLIMLLLVGFLNLNHFAHLHIQPLLIFALAVITVLLAGKELYQKALVSLRNKSITLELFIAISATAGLILTVISLFTGNENLNFSEVFASVVGIVYLGSWLERKVFAYVKSKMPQAVRIFPRFYKAILHGIGKSKHVNLETKLISENTQLILAKGEICPADGIITSGKCWVESAFITGQSFPQFKQDGYMILAGEKILDGAIQLVTTSSFYNSSLLKLVRACKNTQYNIGANSFLQRLLGFFVPTVLVTSCISFFYHLPNLRASIEASLAVLVVACPCAIGIAAPLALSLGVLKMLHNGVLVKNAQAFFTLFKPRKVYLDKTGTLTYQKYEVTDFNITDKETISRLYSAQLASNHPFASSLISYLKKFEPFEIYSVEELKVDQQSFKCYFSDKAYLNIKKKDSTYEFLVTLNGREMGTFQLQEKLKNDFDRLIQTLNRKNIPLTILSGDTVRSDFFAMCEKLGIPFKQGITAEEKQNIIRQEALRPNVFIGDGINDALALKEADCGVTFEQSSFVNLDSADVVLKTDSLLKIKETFDVSEKVIQVVHQNLIWGILFNAIAIPFAAFGYIPPSVAAIAMGLSDIVVVGNSLRLLSK